RLLEQVGVASFHRRLEDLGFALEERPDHYGLGLVLGSGEVTLLQLASAFATMARQGLAIEAQLTPESTPAKRQVGEPGAWWLTLKALDDPNARAPAFGADSVLEPEHPLAAKTGTSVGWRDNWAVGATPQVVVAVWVGNFDGSPMASVSGVTGAGPLMAQVVALTHDPYSGQQDFLRPKSITRAPICLPSGMAPSENCPSVVREFFLRGTQPTEPDTWWTLAELDTSGALATGCPGAEPTLLLRYPSSAKAWAQAAGQDPWPTQDHSCTIQPTQAATSGRILSPAADSVWYLDPQRDPETQAIALRGHGDSNQDLIWLIDEQPIAELQAHQVGRWVPTPGPHRVALLQGDTVLDQVDIWVSGSTKESP
ncbi:MAG: membrane carboxypeptidase/penicillin-binding protein PbpC, partial [Cognaticolwellia sp.]